MASDRTALVALYNATDGANWVTSTNWLSDRPLGAWHGVTTNSDGRVTELLLWDNQLTGPIPAWLGDLTNLQWLWLSVNELTGPIPAELGDLTNLTGLDLAGNQLMGPIPAELGDLTNLEWLSLASNQLAGCIPGDCEILPRMILPNSTCPIAAQSRPERRRLQRPHLLPL